MPKDPLRILLIQPYITSHDKAILTEPLGLLALATYLEKSLKNEVTVGLLDLFALGYDQCVTRGQVYVRGVSKAEDILRYVMEFSPDVVGLACNFTAYAEDPLEVAKTIKDSLPKIITVVGGAHATVEAETILKSHPYVDYVIRGEGEITLCELVNSIREGSGIERVLGLSYRDGKQIVCNADRDLIEDIDSLPIPDRKYIDMERYKKINAEALWATRKYPAASIMTSRGCPFNCVFCSTKRVWRRIWRPRAAQKVAQEIEYLVNTYGIREIAIYDDQFVVDAKRVHEICDLIIRKNLGVSLSIPSGTSVWLVDRELLEKMKRAGFYRLCFPVETANKKTMKFVGKPINLDKVKETIAIANKLGFWTTGNFIIGFPYETREEVRETISYAYQSGLDLPLFLIAQPHAGSEMYDIFEKEGLLDPMVRGSHVRRTGYDTKTLRASELNEIRKKAAGRMLVYKFAFYLHPHNLYSCLLPKLSTRDDIKYALRILMAMLKG
jgi:radical SAM superfamily enzyme YgiQ (UPF0313 family)